MSEMKSDLLYVSPIILVLFLTNYPVLDSWFIVDDTACIFCSSFDTLRLLFDRGTYIFFNQLFFTPFLPISFKLDWFLFKMSPTGYHIHNLLVASLCCILFFQLLKIYMSAFFSWLGTLFLSLSLPVSFDIGWITRRHYLWGFLFSLMALYFFKKWEERKASLIMVLSLFCTVLAFLCKEAYLCLPAVIFILSPGGAGQRIKKAAGYIGVFVLYLLWRIYMLGGIGGYAGSTHKPLYYFLSRWLSLPIDMSNTLVFPYFSFVIIFVLILLAVNQLRMAIGLFFILLSVSAPFIFFPSGGFLLANKGLGFAAAISFTLAYSIYASWTKEKKAVAIFLFGLFAVSLIGSFREAQSGHEIILKQSGLYENASQELLNHRDEKILVISDTAYYFSNLGDIYRGMLNEQFPEIRAASTVKVIPFLESHDFDRVIEAEGLSLDSINEQRNALVVLGGEEADDFLARHEKEFEKEILQPPRVNFIPSDSHLTINIIDQRKGTYLRCLYRDTYIGCYPIPKLYVFKCNSVKEFEKIDIIYLSDSGGMSRPATFRRSREK